MAKRKRYPCSTCVRVDDPNKCENKSCKLWKEWFLERWDEIHESCKKIIEEKEKANDRLQ